MNKNCIRGRRGGASWHNTAKPSGLAAEVNAAVVRRRTAPLPGEISIARGRESDSAVRSNALGDGREVSRGHSTSDENRGAGRCPFNQRDPQARTGKDRTETIARPGGYSTALNPTGGARNGGAIRQRKRGYARPLFRKERWPSFTAHSWVARRPEPPCYGPVWPVVWGAGVQSSRLPDSAFFGGEYRS